MQFTYKFDLILQAWNQSLREWDSAVFFTFPFPNEDLFAIKVDVLDSESASFHESKTAAVHEAAHETFGTGLNGFQ
jgi:hypothetical protein